MDMEEIYARMGRNLIYLRAQYSMSRKTLAKLIDIPLTRLRRVEAGGSRARVYDFHLCRMANVFDLSTDSLLYEDLCRTKS